MRTSQTNSQFADGFIAAIIAMAVFVGGVKVVLWAVANPAVALFVEWATTPQISPIGLLGALLITTVLSYVVGLST